MSDTGPNKTVSYTVSVTYAFDVEVTGVPVDQRHAAAIAFSDYCRANPAQVAFDADVELSADQQTE